MSHRLAKVFVVALISFSSCNRIASVKTGALIENIGHTNLHYGNLITYLRLLGLTPPSN